MGISLRVLAAVAEEALEGANRQNQQWLQSQRIENAAHACPRLELNQIQSCAVQNEALTTVMERLHVPDTKGEIVLRLRLEAAPKMHYGWMLYEVYVNVMFYSPTGD